MGSVRQRQSGKWQAMYRDPEGKQRSQSFSSRREPDRFLGRQQVEVERGEWRDPQLGKTPFSEVAATWRAQKTSLRLSTLSHYDSLLSCHVIPGFTDRPINSIKPSDIRGWVNSMQTRGVGGTTIVKAFGLVEQIMDLAVEDRLIPVSPMPRKNRPKVPKPDEMRVLSTQQFADLADAIRPHYRPLIETAVWTGMRWGELAGLRNRRVDLLRGRIEVAEQRSQIRGVMLFGEPKTKAGRRSLDIPPKLAPALEASLGNDPDGLVFLTEEGTPVHHSNFLQRIWTPATAAADLSGIRFHDLRHTHVSWLIDMDVNLVKISRRVGHTKVSFTLDRYAHLLPTDDDDIADRLERYGTITDPEARPGRLLGFDSGSAEAR